jgi:hypothetical protein
MNTSTDRISFFRRQNGVDSEVFKYSYSSDNVIFNGNVGIGTINPATEFELMHQVGASTQGLTIRNVNGGGGWWSFCMTTSPAPDLTFRFAGNKVGTFNFISGNYQPISDRRVKKNIEPLPSILNDVLALSPKSYHFKTQDDTEIKEIGLVAQDVEDIFPNLVSHDDEDDLYSLNYSGLGVLAVAAIKEQQEIIDSQEARITQLEKMMMDLKRTLEE